MIGQVIPGGADRDSLDFHRVVVATRLSHTSGARGDGGKFLQLQIARELGTVDGGDKRDELKLSLTFSDGGGHWTLDSRLTPPKNFDFGFDVRNRVSDG